MSQSKTGCGCDFKQVVSYTEIIYCPLHQAAPILLEAAKSLLEALKTPDNVKNLAVKILKTSEAVIQAEAKP